MRVAAGLAGCALVLSACADDTDRSAAAAGSTPTATAAPTPTRTPTGPDPAEVGANELGDVPVIMYHQIIENARREEDRTPAEFREELESFYAEGYRPVTAADFVTGTIDLPAGTHPIVLTFDDSTISQAQLGADGDPDPDTALGMLEAMGEKYDDFDPTATFYVNTFPKPYVDDAVLPWLAANGYEIGAHTRSHAALRKLDDAGVQEEIGRNVAELEASVLGYEVTTFATTYGIFPTNRDLAVRGSHAGMQYEFEGVYGVSSVSSVSPFAGEFSRYNVPRIGSGLGVTVVALKRLRENPELRYTSDGDPDHISFPAELADRLDPEYEDRAQPY